MIHPDNTVFRDVSYTYVLYKYLSMNCHTEMAKRDYIMAGHAFPRVLKAGGSRHELQTFKCFIHRYGFVATEERFSMCSVKTKKEKGGEKKRKNKKEKRERKPSPYIRES